MTEVAEQTMPLIIDVVSDVVCPWCFIGKRRLEAALKLRPDLPVQINWRPFQLDSTIPADGMPREVYLERKFGSQARIKEIYARVTAAGATEGIPFAFDKITRSPNTLGAHRLIRWAHGVGKQDAIKEALMNAYFIEGRDLSSTEELIAISGENGMDADMVASFFDTEADVESVTEEIAMAGKLGISGVPFFIFGGTHAVSGAESAETLANAMDQAVAAQAQAQAAE